MPKISVPVLWNSAGLFLNSNPVIINADATVIGYSNQPLLPYPPGFLTPVMTQTLEIKDQQLGSLYLPITLTAYQDIVRSAIANPTLIAFEVPGTTPTGTTITNASLYKASIISVVKNGIPIVLTSGYTYTSNSNGTGTITLAVALVNNDVVAIQLFYL